jgi:hypothetical protein
MTNRNRNFRLNSDATWAIAPIARQLAVIAARERELQTLFFLNLVENPLGRSDSSRTSSIMNLASFKNPQWHSLKRTIKRVTSPHKAALQQGDLQ